MSQSARHFACMSNADSIGLLNPAAQANDPDTAVVVSLTSHRQETSPSRANCRSVSRVLVEANFLKNRGGDFLD